MKPVVVVDTKSLLYTRFDGRRMTNVIQPVGGPLERDDVEAYRVDPVAFIEKRRAS